MSRVFELLEKTSRTFALSIPLLPSALAHDVALAYLLFRIADTIEDTPHHTSEEKRAALGRLIVQMRAFEPATEPVLPEPVVDSADDLELLESSEFVLAELHQLSADKREAITRHVERSAVGMASFLTDDSNPRELIRIESLSRLRDYCYAVAGIVGEMLVDLFLIEDSRLESKQAELNRLARYFGEGLQLVNILKDQDGDADDGRFFVPQQVPRSELFDLARSDLRLAEDFTEILITANTDVGVIRFCQLPVRLAFATLDQVEIHGSGTKIGRKHVFQIIQSVLEPTGSMNS